MTERDTSGIERGGGALSRRALIRATAAVGLCSVVVGHAGAVGTDAAAEDPTFVTENVAEDETWTAAEGPYRVTSSIAVEEGATLGIEPGTEIQFVDGVTLTVEGTLSAAGSADAGVTLTGFEGVYGIVVESAGTLSLENASVDSVDEDIVLGGGNASVTESTIDGSIGYRNDGSKLSLTGSTVTGQLYTVFTGTRPDVDGVELVETEFTTDGTVIDFEPDRHVRDVLVEGCTFAGEVRFRDSFEITSDIESRSIRLRNSEFAAPVVFGIEFEESTIENNRFTGSGDGLRTTTVRNTDIVGNEFSDNDGSGAVLNDVGGSVAVRENTVEDNGSDGLRASVDDVVTVEGNVIRENGGSGVSIDAVFNPDLTGVVEGNRVVTNAEHGIEFFECELDAVTFSDNEVLANGEVGLGLDATNDASDGDASTLSGNVLAYNDVGLLLRNANETVVEGNAIARNESAGIHLDRPEDTITGNNVFENGLGVRTGEEGGAEATENYWGAESGPFVEGVNPEGEGDEVESDGENVAVIPWAETPVEAAPEVPENDFGPSLSDYADGETGQIDIGGLQNAIDDWRAGDIEISLLYEVIEAWRSGENVLE